MRTSDIITIVISSLSLAVSIIALISELITKKKVNKLTDLEIERLKTETERSKKAIVYGYIENDCFIIKNKGEALATNVKYDGWPDWEKNNSFATIHPYDSKCIDLYSTKDSPSQCRFSIVWDDEIGENHKWSEVLKTD